MFGYYVHVGTGTHGGQKNVLDPLELGLQAVTNYQM